MDDNLNKNAKDTISQFCTESAYPPPPLDKNLAYSRLADSELGRLTLALADDEPHRLFAHMLRDQGELEFRSNSRLNYQQFQRDYRTLAGHILSMIVIAHALVKAQGQALTAISTDDPLIERLITHTRLLEICASTRLQVLQEHYATDGRYQAIYEGQFGHLANSNPNFKWARARANLMGGGYQLFQRCTYLMKIVLHYLHALTLQLRFLTNRWNHRHAAQQKLINHKPWLHPHPKSFERAYQRTLLPLDMVFYRRYRLAANDKAWFKALQRPVLQLGRGGSFII